MAEDAQGTPTQSRISPSILTFEDCKSKTSTWLRRQVQVFETLHIVPVPPESGYPHQIVRISKKAAQQRQHGLHPRPINMINRQRGA